MDSLYREELMELYKHPTHKGQLTAPTSTATKKNPMCGDEITLQLAVKDGKITDAKFDGIACSVTVISSELLSENVIGKTIDEAKKITKDDFLKAVNLNLTTSRVQCAVLALTALSAAIKDYETK